MSFTNIKKSNNYLPFSFSNLSIVHFLKNNFIHKNNLQIKEKQNLK